MLRDFGFREYYRRLFILRLIDLPAFPNVAQGLFGREEPVGGVSPSPTTTPFTPAGAEGVYIDALRSPGLGLSS